MLVKMHACAVSVYQALSKEPGYEANIGVTPESWKGMYKKIPYNITVHYTSRNMFGT